jgi:hypothetical protein
MDERKATDTAARVGGAALQAGGNIWVVVAPMADGKALVISEDIVAVYASRAAFSGGDEPLWSRSA